MAFPKPSEAAKARFAELVESVPGATVKPMFGNAGGFLPTNGQMFLSLFGELVSVRLAEDDRSALLDIEGTALLEPMPGKPMKEYVSFPADWVDDDARLQPWIDKSIHFVEGLPSKR